MPRVRSVDGRPLVERARGGMDHGLVIALDWTAVAALALAVTSCAGSARVPHAVSSPPASAAIPSAAKPLLSLGELRVLQRGKLALVLYRNGLLEDHGELVGTLGPDGRFVDLFGHLCAAMDPDGSIHFDGGVITIAEDGSTSAQIQGVSATSLRFDEAGHVVGAPEPTEVRGLSPELRRTAMFALLLPDLLRLLRPLEVH